MKKNNIFETRYLAPACEVLTFATEGLLCDSDEGRGGIDPWRFTENPMTF